VDDQGGVVMSSITRNHIKIWQNSVPNATPFVVWGRVIANYVKPDQKANEKRPDGLRERLIAPVMEYHINDGSKIFHRHVKAVIYPAVKLPLSDSRQKLRVYLESEGEEIEAVEKTKSEVEEILLEQAGYTVEFSQKVEQRLKEVGIFYTIQNDGTIAVYTFHFSLIICAIIEPAVREDVDYIRGILTAKLSTTRDQKQRILLEFFVQFIRTSQQTNTYWEVRFHEVSKSKILTIYVYLHVSLFYAICAFYVRVMQQN
jgi:hypothetical protein